MSFVETFRKAEPRRQLLLVVGAVAVLCLVLAAAYAFLLHKPYAVLFSDLRTADAATIVADLDKKKIPYRLKDGGATILVPDGRVDATRLAVMTEDLPLKGTVGFELFNKSDMGLTEFAQQINYQRALEGELARTLMGLDGVEFARVHLSLSEPSVFQDQRRPAKASVTLTPREGRQLSTSLVGGVRRLVAAAVTDLQVNDVVVLDEQGGVISDGTEAVEPTGPPAVQEQAGVEAYYAARVRRALLKFYPEDQIQVSVTAIAPAAPTTDPLSADPFADWSPSLRSFPLSVRIVINAPVGPEIRDQLIAAAHDALGGANSISDGVTVAMGQAAPMPTGAGTRTSSIIMPAATSPVVAAPTTSGWLASPKNFSLGLLGPLLLLLGVGIVVLARFAPGRRRMNAKVRASYTQRLNALLDEEDGHAPTA